MISLDHAVVLVRDLDAAAPAYRRLGFELTPRGRHGQLGTANHTIVFRRDYLELMTVEERRPANARWADSLDRGEGLALLALATNDARALYRTLVERRVAAAEPIDFGRSVARPSGPVEARFTVCIPEPDASPAIPAFFCQHHTPEHVWLEEYQGHPNTARGIAAITVVTPRPDRVLPAYERLLGKARVHPRPGGVTLTVGRARVWLIQPDYAADRLARHRAPPAGPLGVTVAVTSVATAKRVLAAAAVPYRAFGRRSILIEPTFTHGVFLELLEG
jgi:hypothetical protein